MIYKNLLQLSNLFDTFLFDAYGVFKLAEGVSPSAIQVLEELMRMGKQVSIISNTTLTSILAEEGYANYGLLKEKHYVELLTSGQFVYEEIQTGKLPLKGNKVYVAWSANPKKTEDLVPALFKNSNYRVVTDMREADFAYCGIPQILKNGIQEDRLEIDDFLPEIQNLYNHKLNLVCANPDFRALEGGKFVIRQGLVSAEYEKMGGKVIYYGKPDSRIYERALKTLGYPNKERVLMVGDTLRTDILGANRAGIKSCLTLAQGVSANELKTQNISLSEKKIQKYANDQGICIDYIIEKLPIGDLFTRVLDHSKER